MRSICVRETTKDANKFLAEKDAYKKKNKLYEKYIVPL